MTEFGAEPILGSYLAVALIAAGLGVLLLLRPGFGRVTPLRRWSLLALRGVVVLLALVALLRPTWITTIRAPRTSVILLLYDVSRSMQLPSGKGEESRWQAMEAAIIKSQSQFAALADKYEMKVYAFDSRLHPVEHRGGAFSLPKVPEGMLTDLGTPLFEAARAEQGKRLAAVVVLSDGAQNAFEPQVEAVEAVRKLRDDFAAALYAVPFGPAADAAQARDVAVERFDEQFTVFVKNELAVKGLLRIRGYVNRDIPLELQLEDEQGQKQVIGKKTARAEEDGRQVEVEFTHTPQKPGNYRLHLVAAQQDGELVAKNNQMSAYLTVLEGGLRVLYLDGEKRFEQKFLRAALNASPDIELDDRIIDRRNQRMEVDLTDDLRTGRYDAFIVGDLDAALLTPASIKLLAEQVAQGKGLIMIGGEASYGWGHYRGTPLEEVLPIEMDPVEGTQLSPELVDRYYRAGPVPLKPADSHPITRLAPASENEAVWQKLTPLNSVHKFSGVKQSPGVRVLLEAPGPEPDPVLVSGEFGRGRVLAFGTDSTWLWQMHGFEKEHKRFWRQVILWLVRRDDLVRDDVWVKLDQRRFNPGSRVQITAGARTGAGDAIADARIDAVVDLPSGGKQTVRLSAERDGNFSGSLEVTEPGDYAIDVAATRQGQTLGSARAEFLVFDRDVELSNIAADPLFLDSLARETRHDGGRLVLPEQLPALLDEYVQKPKEYEERQIKWKLASTAADAWAFFLTLVGALSLEWYLRKRWGLV
jgi:uncharacterized membrane protein